MNRLRVYTQAFPQLRSAHNPPDEDHPKAVAPEDPEPISASDDPLDTARGAPSREDEDARHIDQVSSRISQEGDKTPAVHEDASLGGGHEGDSVGFTNNEHSVSVGNEHVISTEAVQKEDSTCIDISVEHGHISTPDVQKEDSTSVANGEHSVSQEHPKRIVETEDPTCAENEEFPTSVSRDHVSTRDVPKEDSTCVQDEEHSPEAVQDLTPEGQVGESVYIPQEESSTSLTREEGSTCVAQEEDPTHLAQEEGIPCIKQEESSTHLAQEESTPCIQQEEESTDSSQERGSTHLAQEDSSTRIEQEEGSTRTMQEEKTPHLNLAQKTPRIEQEETGPRNSQETDAQSIGQEEDATRIAQEEDSTYDIPVAYETGPSEAQDPMIKTEELDVSGGDSERSTPIESSIQSQDPGPAHKDEPSVDEGKSQGDDTDSGADECESGSRGSGSALSESSRSSSSRSRTSSYDDASSSSRSSSTGSSSSRRERPMKAQAARYRTPEPQLEGESESEEGRARTQSPSSDGRPWSPVMRLEDWGFNESRPSSPRTERPFMVGMHEHVARKHRYRSKSNTPTGEWYDMDPLYDVFPRSSRVTLTDPKCQRFVASFEERCPSGREEAQMPVAFYVLMNAVLNVLRGLRGAEQVPWSPLPKEGAWLTGSQGARVLLTKGLQEIATRDRASLGNAPWAYLPESIRNRIITDLSVAALAAERLERGLIVRNRAAPPQPKLARWEPQSCTILTQTELLPFCTVSIIVPCASSHEQ